MKAAPPLGVLEELPSGSAGSLAFWALASTALTLPGVFAWLWGQTSIPLPWPLRAFYGHWRAAMLWFGITRRVRRLHEAMLPAVRLGVFETLRGEAPAQARTAAMQQYMLRTRVARDVLLDYVWEHAPELVQERWAERLQTLNF